MIELSIISTPLRYYQGVINNNMFCHVTVDRDVPKLLQINENGTRFYLTPEGRKYPSVTTVLSEYSKQGILEWRKKIGFEEANKIANKAATRGTKLHKLCENYLNNQEIKFETPIESELFTSVKPLLHNINNIRFLEQRLYSNHLRLAGTVDCIAEYNGKISVIDFKTSSKLKKPEYIENYFMQCSAYAVMVEELYNIPVNNLTVIIAVESEKPQVFEEKRNKWINKLIDFRDLYEKNHGFSIA